jgi:proteasome accessory factor C
VSRPGPAGRFGGTPGRLGRLLNLVPYFLARPGVLLSEAAAELGVTEAQLRDDLQLLFVCGLPGYGPGDLIDMSIDDDTVTITYDAGIDRPLKLTADEALALVVALRALADVPGLDSSGAVQRALATLESAAGDAAGAGGLADRITVSIRPSSAGPSAGRDAATLAAVNSALERRRAVRMTYYTAGRDAIGERVVDPVRLLFAQGRTYLEAWCRRVEAMRRFRLDRIDALAVLDEAATPPARALLETRGGDAEVFSAAADSPLVVLRVGRASRWVAEYFPCEEVVAEPGGWWQVRLRASDLAWARRLVLGLGTDVAVLGPPELRAAVASEAATALAAYDAG